MKHRLAAFFLATALGAWSADAQVFVSNYNDHAIGEYALNGSGINSGLIGVTGPTGLAISPTNGNLYVAFQGDGEVGEYTQSGSTVNASLITADLNGPLSIAFDSSGDLYVTNSGSTGGGDNNTSINGTVSEFTSSGTLITTSFISGMNSPSGLAVDSSGNFYVADYNTGAVEKYSSAGGSTPLLTITGLSNPFGVAVSSAGNIYVANATANTIEEFNSGGSLLNTASLGSNTRPTALAIAGGELYEVNQFGDNVGEFNLDLSAVNPDLISGIENGFGLTAVPEPASYALILGVIALAFAAVRRRPGRASVNLGKSVLLLD